MSWVDKISKFGQFVKSTKEAEKQVASGLCIHGEINCMRCEEENRTINSSPYQYMMDEDIKATIFALNTISEDLITIMKKCAGNVYLAGGFMRAIIEERQPKDIDWFVSSLAQAVITRNELSNYLISNMRKLDEECFACEISQSPVQIVWRYPFDNASELLDRFDFTVAKAAIWYSNEKSQFVGICHNRYYRDIANKELVYERFGDVERILSIPRLMRYHEYGYSIGPESLAKVILHTALSLDPSKGYEGMLKDLQEAYKPNSLNPDWLELNKQYAAPKKTYTYGS